MITSAQLSALYVGLKSLYSEGYQKTASGIEDQWQEIAMTVSSETSEEDYSWMENLVVIREWVGDRQLQKMKESGFKIKNKKFEGTVTVPADKIKDRKLGGFNIATKQLGGAVRKFPNRLVFPLLRDGHKNRGIDGQYFFDNNHPVVMADGSVITQSNKLGDDEGVAWYVVDTTQEVKPIVFQDREKFNFVSLTEPTTENVFMRDEFYFGVAGRCNVGYGLWQTVYRCTLPLTQENVDKIRTEMQGYKAGNGEPIGIMPNTLLVPASLESAAKKVCEATILGGDTNVMKGSLKVQTSLWLG